MGHPSPVRQALKTICLFFISFLIVLLWIAPPGSAAPDDYEPDNTPETAHTITQNSQNPDHQDLPGYTWYQTRNFYDDGDVDWVLFYGVEDQPYQVTAYIEPLASGMDPVDGQNGDPAIRIYADDGETLLQGPEDRSGLGETEKLDNPFTCPYTGAFYILVSQCDATTPGCSASYGEGTEYQLELTQLYMNFGGMIYGTVTPPGAIVTTTAVSSGVFTGGSGEYFLPHIAGEFTFTASAPGYLPYESPFTLSENDSIEISTDLVEDLCPDDPDKTSPGLCGCGVSDSDGFGDMDGNEVIDLSDAINALRLLAGHDDGLSPPCAARVGLDWAIHVLKQTAK